MNERPVMWSFVAVGLVLAMSLGATSPGVAAPVAAGQHAVVVDQEVDTFVRDRLEALGIPGAAVAVAKDGQVAHLAGYGDADPEGRPVTPDTPFLLGSTSKVFTSTAVLTLVKQGRLSLDKKVLPLLKDEVSSVPDGFDEVTVRELLTHTSGLGTSFLSPSPTSRAPSSSTATLASFSWLPWSKPSRTQPLPSMSTRRCFPPSG